MLENHDCHSRPSLMPFHLNYLLYRLHRRLWASARRTHIFLPKDTNTGFYQRLKSIWECRTSHNPSSFSFTILLPCLPTAILSQDLGIVSSATYQISNWLFDARTPPFQNCQRVQAELNAEVKENFSAPRIYPFAPAPFVLNSTCRTPHSCICM